MLTLAQRKSVISRDTVIVPRKLDWMVLDRAEDLKSIMSDNATFVQFPPIGSSASLITVFGDHRVNVQRTIRSIMQLVRLLPPFLTRYEWVLVTLGLPILCRIVLAATDPVQRAPPAYDTQLFASDDASEADIAYDRRGSCVQEYVLRDAWSRVRGVCCSDYDPGIGYRQGTYFLTLPK